MIIISMDIFILITIISSKSLEASSIYQYVNSSLNNQGTFNARMFLETAEGILLYCFDSFGNQFGITIPNKKFLCINYNNLSQCNSLFNICGCKSCERKWINIELKFSEINITFVCNNQRRKTLSFMNIQKKSKEEEKHFKIMKLPKEMINKSQRRLFIMIGNIAPYTSENNEEISPLKEQIVACLDTFTYNKKIIPFKQNGKKVLSYCPQVCYNATCNGGLCEIKSMTDFFCNCSTTALNGVYCNTSLEEYREGKNNSYESLKNASDIYLKFTWKFTSLKIYCLVNIERRSEDITVWIHKGKLKIDDKVITTVSIRRIFYMSIIINDYNLILHVDNKTLEKKLLFSKSNKINVGFSAKNGTCETFEGMFDFHYDFKNIRQVYQSVKESNKSNVLSNKSNFSEILIIFVAAAIMFVILLICGLKMLLRSFCTNGNTEEERVEMSTQNIAEDIRTTSGVYSTVDYMKMQSTSRSDNEDTDGYIIPRPEVIVEDPPTLPPRNENLL